MDLRVKITCYINYKPFFLVLINVEKKTTLFERKLYV